MERHQDYEPLILDLQKSQAVQHPKRGLFVSLIAIAAISLLAAITFGVLYLTTPASGPDEPTGAPQSGGTTSPAASPTPSPTAVSRMVADATPTPEPTLVPTQAPPTPTPEPATGFLTLYSSPANAEVIIDGESLGRTPLERYELAVGTYTVTFAHNGDISDYTITIRDGETSEYRHQFTGFASLRIRTIPSNSSIFLNGELAGQASSTEGLEISGLLAGTYTITARKPNYASVEKTVVLSEEKHQDVDMFLRPLGIGSDSTDAPESTPLPLHPSERQSAE